MDQRKPSLVAQYWTVSGRSPADAEAGQGWSPFSLEARCDAARRAGFVGLGLFWPDIQHLLETASLKRMGELVRAHGIEVVELEYLWDWFLPPGDPRRSAADAARDLLFDAAAEFGAHHIKVGNLSGAPCPPEMLTERFAELCALAAERHDAAIVYEPTPFDANLHDVGSSVAVIGDAAAPNGALALDTWHLAMMDIAPSELRRIPAELVGWVELSDGTRAGVADPQTDCVDHRAVPGDGDLPVAEYLAAARDIGYDGPWGIEVLSQEFRSVPMEEMFTRAFAGGMKVHRPAASAPLTPLST